MNNLIELPSCDFAKLLSQVDHGRIPVEACNFFFPAEQRITEAGVDFEALTHNTEEALR
ncbi:MAG: hypothetical protein SNJ78_07680 [Spirochaetales bacterium]